MADHFMTVLGTGGYNECTYVDFDKKNKIINASYNTSLRRWLLSVFSAVTIRTETGLQFLLQAVHVKSILLILKET